MAMVLVVFAADLDDVLLNSTMRHIFVVLSVGPHKTLCWNSYLKALLKSLLTMAAPENFQSNHDINHKGSHSKYYYQQKIYCDTCLEEKSSLCAVCVRLSLIGPTEGQFQWDFSNHKDPHGYCCLKCLLACQQQMKDTHWNPSFATSFTHLSHVGDSNPRNGLQWEIETNTSFHRNTENVKHIAITTE